MNLIQNFLQWVFEPRADGLADGEERYLAGAVDMLDLERRMRELDERRPIGPFALNA